MEGASSAAEPTAAAQAAAQAAAAATTTVSPLAPAAGTSGGGGATAGGGGAGGGGAADGDGVVSTLTTLLRDNVRHTQHVVHQLNTVQQTLGELTEQIARLVGETVRHRAPSHGGSCAVGASLTPALHPPQRRLSGHPGQVHGAQAMGTLLPSQSHAAQAAHAAAQHAAAAAAGHHHTFHSMPMGDNGLRRPLR